jgi:hypothetical protein
VVSKTTTDPSSILSTLRASATTEEGRGSRGEKRSTAAHLGLDATLLIAMDEMVPAGGPRKTFALGMVPSDLPPVDSAKRKVLVVLAAGRTGCERADSARSRSSAF